MPIRNIFKVGVWPAGKYKGVRFEDLPKSYVVWLFNNNMIINKELFSILNRILEDGNRIN